MNKGWMGEAGRWLQGLAWAAMVFCGVTALGCTAAGAQSYLVTSPARYVWTSMGQGDGGQNTNSGKDELFNGTDIFAKGASNVTEITMDPDTLNLVGGSEEHRAHRMVLNVVHTYEYDKPGMYNMADVDRFRDKLNSGDWHCSVHTRDSKTGSSTDICEKHRSDGLRESAIISVEPKQLTFIHTIRKIGPGESELGFFPMLPGVSPTTLMAMNDPDAFAQMQLGMRGGPMMFGPDQNFILSPLDQEQLRKMQQQMKNLKPLDEKQIQKLQEQMKNLKPLSEEQVRELQEEATDLKPLNGEQMKELNRQMEKLRKSFPPGDEEVAPAAPAIPAAPAQPPQPE